jgi:hypothetical protein
MIPPFVLVPFTVCTKKPGLGPPHVMVDVPEVPRVMLLGVKLHASWPAAAKFTGPVKPFEAVTVTLVIVVVWPAVPLGLEGLTTIW